MIKFLIEKEFKQLLRNSFLPKMILIFPCMIMILMPWAANLEIKNINLNIVDNDHSVLTMKDCASSKSVRQILSWRFPAISRRIG